MNTINDWKTIATIHNSERLEWNRRIFGGDTCPVVSIVPFRVSVPGHPDTLAYNLDLKALTSEQRQRLVESIAERFNLAPAYVAENLDSQGVPILAADVVVSSSDQGMMFSMMDDLDLDDDWDREMEHYHSDSEWGDDDD